MISKLTIKNFKSWRDFSNVKFAKLTAFFGINSSGKTSIIDFLLLLKQTIESSDRSQVLEFGDSSQYVQLGSFDEIIYNHNVSENLSFDIQIELPSKLRIADPKKKNKILFEDKLLRFFSEISQTKSRRLFVQEMSYSFAHQKFTMKKQKKDRYDYKLNSESANNYIKYRLKRTPGRAWALPEPEKFYGFPDQVRTYYQNAGFLFDLQLSFEQYFSNVFYLGPLREYPQRQYTWTGAQPNDMGRRGERFVDAILASREGKQRISRGKGSKKLTVEEYVAYWLKELGLIHSFSISEIAKGSNIYQIKVKNNENSTSVLLTDVGFGVSQILPVLTLCYYVPKGSTLIIEQPEIHLHPRIQAGLADVFIDAIKRKHVQIILESHSEYLLRRLQRRIAEGTIDSNDIAAYFCKNNGAESSIEDLDVDLFGNIRNWPEGFFGDEFGEMAAMTKAILERQRIE